jgi:CDP-diacylglycerol--glycerol-3-phosphate 3-phosphatidyltransferase
MNIANQITLVRLILIPFIIYGYLYEDGGLRWITALVVLFAGLSDWLDGYFARKKQQETYLGQILDPLADKVLVISILMMIAFSQQSVFIASVLVLFIIRDLTISSVRELHAGLGNIKALSPSLLGKLKTVMQMCSLILLVLVTTDYPLLMHLGFVLLTVSLLMSYVSLFYYLKKSSLDLTFFGKKE